MLERSVRELIRECRHQAEDCARKAAASTDPKLKQEFLNMEQRWLWLVRSYEFTERLNDLCDDGRKDLSDQTEQRADIR